MNAKITTYVYPAYQTQQTPSGKPLVLFAARATEISDWVGVPQRSRLQDEQTIGFQRQESKTRIRELSSFYHDERNVVQNPLLAAPQGLDLVEFIPEDGHPQFGTLRITSRDFSDDSLLDLMKQVVQRLELRVPSLAEMPLDQIRMASIMERGRLEHGLDDSGEVDEDEDVDEANAAGVDDSDAASVLLTDETHITDFYTELRGRIKVLEALDESANPERVLGFDRTAMISYLKPVMLVDGQHRLKGAVLAAEMLTETDEGKEYLLKSAELGMDPGEASSSFVAEHVRQLPVSMLMDDSPSEHVFQFVVVNQKATPLNKALLGTIVSTSLSKEELEPVAQRLKNADIKLEDSQAIAYLTRSDDSPFKNLVQTGISGDQNTSLQWSVLTSLVNIFRKFSGGKLYGEKNDWARVWAKHHLEDSAFVSQFETQDERLAEWARADGPWRDVFVRFYSNIRDKFGSSDMEASNAWGNSQRNLFNKVSLTILAADYFEYLRSQKKTLSSVGDVDATMESWLEDVSPAYFNRNWNVSKKDVPAVRNRWAKLWVDYRKNPESLPKESLYNPVSGV
ncbi:hypothetical protein ACIA8O_12020 [Kitasatospora sp. NPDC051853]|uniref:hypothetical protein n=1 Tax=Kitasatospora sp. NPDC051853 TaxID=3364058 RepID=UPI0037B80618